MYDYSKLFNEIERRGYTREDFRKLTGFDDNKISRIYNGSVVRDETLKKLCEAFQMELKDLVELKIEED